MQAISKAILNIKWVEEIDSTNSEMLRSIGSWKDLETLAAVNQTAGRGQRGNSWKIVSGKNLTFSTLLRGNSDSSEGSLGDLPAKEQFIISEITTLAVRDYLRSKGIDAKIKWPNDIYVGNRKICGMLIENGLSPKGTVAHSVLGIGLNVNQNEFPPEILNPTSMTLLTGQTYDLQKELAELVCILCEKLGLLSDPDKAHSDYVSDLYRLGQWNDYTDCATAQVFRGKITDVTKEGRLIVEDAEGKLRDYAFKEISYII